MTNSQDKELGSIQLKENQTPSTSINDPISNGVEETNIEAFESAYRVSLAAFKKDKSNKDLRRAKSGAKKAWDDAIKATEGGEQLTCRDCSHMFMFTAEDQGFYLDKGWSHRPSRCKGCSEKNKARLENRTGRDSKTKNMCFAFQKGECGYGDKCRFSHDPKGKTKDDANGDSGDTPKSKPNKFRFSKKSSVENDEESSMDVCTEAKDTKIPPSTTKADHKGKIKDSINGDSGDVPKSKPNKFRSSKNKSAENNESTSTEVCTESRDTKNPPSTTKAEKSNTKKVAKATRKSAKTRRREAKKRIEIEMERKDKAVENDDSTSMEVCTEAKDTKIPPSTTKAEKSSTKEEHKKTSMDVCIEAKDTNILPSSTKAEKSSTKKEHKKIAKATRKSGKTRRREMRKRIEIETERKSRITGKEELKETTIGNKNSFLNIGKITTPALQ